MLGLKLLTDVLASNGVDVYENFLVGNKPSPFTDLASLINLLYKSLLVLAGIVLFFLLILGGFNYLAGAGQEKSNQVEKGKKAITGAIIGFLLVFAAYWIVQIISLLTGVKILNSSL